ncbi:MAG TPA: hypothetical protein VF546_00285 [Pyrinomonadaceae bacterium]|jgi:hypothetical protein
MKLHRPLTVCALTLACWLALCPRARAAATTWHYVATHPEAAAADPTWGARWLWALQPWRGRLFVGYGSFNGANPRAVIRAFDPAAGRFSAAPAFATDNEAVGLFREIAGRLYVPTMDAHSGGLSLQNFAVTTDDTGDAWADRAARPMYHNWDVATLDGRDLWLVGTDADLACPVECSDAVAYRSTDGGLTFTEMVRVAAPDAGYKLGWFQFAFAFNGKLYLQAYFRFSTTAQPDLVATQSYVYDGRAWATGPDLLPRRSQGDSGYNPVPFDNHVVYLTQVPISRSYPKALPLWQNRIDLAAFDAEERVCYLKIPGGVANFTVAGRYLYVLARDGQIRRTRSLAIPWKQWEALPAFPVEDPTPQMGNAGRSLAVLGNALYVGTTQAELWQLELGKTPAAPSRSATP